MRSTTSSSSRAALTALFAAAAAASLLLAGCGKPADAQPGGPGGPPQAPPVSVAPAVQRSVSDTEEFSGRLEAIDFVDLRPQITGTIQKVHFVDGTLVKKGDLLFTIDPRPFEAEVARAQATLVAARSRSELAQSQLVRAKTLLDAQAASKEEFDQLTSGSRTSQADIQGADAALRVARLNLDYTQVRAPIGGRVSLANIRVGNLVTPASVLTSIAGVARVYAYFDGSESTFLRLQALKAGDKAPRVQMSLANESNFPHDGQLDFVDNRLNPQTGAIRMRASFDNSKGQFTPGLAARLRMVSPQPYDAVLVPERALGTDQSKKFVYVVGSDGKPQFREVHPGALFENMRVIEGGGVKAGENVVVDGVQRIQPGMTVAPQVLKVDAQGMPIFPPPPAQPGAAAAASAPASPASPEAPASSGSAPAAATA